MSILSMLSAVLIGPLKLGFEVIFTCAYRFIGNPGLAIICLSLIMNVLVLPLYRRADAMQEQARDTEARLHKGVVHIKKTFSGDERMMILNTYYRQNNYKATSALNGSISLLLEIPFFLAAYQFLSGLEILNGVSFGPIRDLGAPDGLLVLGGVTVNLLPILMTLINCVSSALYLKGFPMKTKVQLYAMALFFLVFLYTSPSCLVFYWTLNNLFSLCKNIFYKIKNPTKVLRILLCGVGIVLAVYGAVFFPAPTLKRRLVVVALGVGLCLPMALALIRPHIHLAPAKKSRAPSGKLFLAACGFLTVFLGLLIPTTFLAASPQEYIDVTYFFDPMWYAVSALCLAAGVFLVWMQVFYRLAGERGKVWFENAAVAACAMALVNYMCFGTDLGTLSSSLKYESGLHFTWPQQVGNLLALAAVGVAIWFVLRRWRRSVAGVLAVAILALGGMSVVNLVTVRRSVAQMQATALQGTEGPVQFSLSRKGRNVVVIMLDRAMGEYVPYLVNEKPELKEKLDGFTYYANTVSFGGHTIFGAPALFGGYEYTPVEMNRRDSELLVDKHNEALKVLPVLFDQAGYDVTVCDPAYAGHQWIPDLSIFADYPDIHTYITSGRFVGLSGKQRAIDSRMRNFFCFSLMKSMPLFTQSTIYNGGDYNQASGLAPAGSTGEALDALPQSSEFIKEFSTIYHMEDMTQITDDPGGAFLSLTNCATHEPVELQPPEYLPAAEVDKEAYNAQNPGRFTLEGRTLQMYDPLQVAHYDTNMAVLLQLGQWFDYLRAQGVYDNTRIILVSDHGYNLWQLRELAYSAGEEDIDLEWYFPLLMVKDFDATGFTVSDEFMTNADVPTLVTQGLMDGAKNPFTGKVIENSEKLAHPQYIIDCHTWSPTDNTGNTFMDSRWLKVSKDAWDLSNWSIRPGGNVTLKEHSDE